MGITCRIAARQPTLTGGAYRVSVRLTDHGGYVAHVATPGPQATTPVNAAWANVRRQRRECSHPAIATGIRKSAARANRTFWQRSK